MIEKGVLMFLVKKGCALVEGEAEFTWVCLTRVV